MLIQALIEFFGARLADVINGFCSQHCHHFSDDSEMKLKYTELHKEYERLVEGHLHDFREQQGLGEAELYKRLRACTEGNELAALVVELVLSCIDFTSFVSIMQSKKRELEHARNSVEFLDDDYDSQRSASESKQ